MNIVKKAICKMKQNSNLIIKVKNFRKSNEEKLEKFTKVTRMIKYSASNTGLWTSDEVDELVDKILIHVEDKMQLMNKEVTEELVNELIEKFI